MTATLEGTASATDPETDAAAPLAADPPHAQQPVPPSLQSWHDPHRGYAWLVTLVITLVAAGTRFWALGFPKSKIFDEVYYASESQEILRYGYEDNRGYMFIVHPPVGKWLIGWGSFLWGQVGNIVDPNGPSWQNTASGWRVAPAIAGILSVVILMRVTRRITRSNTLGGIAGLLLALDGVSLVLSRSALLDIFLQFFVIAGFAALVVDRDQVRGRLAGLVAGGADLSGGLPTFGPRPWRLLGAVMLACACGVKWSALSFFVVFVLLSVWWDRGALRAAGVDRPARVTLRRSALPGLGSLVLIPIGTYLLCYLGWFLGENSWNRHWADTHGTSTRLNLLGVRVPFTWAWVPNPIRSLGDYTLNAYRFHEHLFAPHSYGSKPWSWLVLGRPVDFFYDGSSRSCGASQCSREVLLIGTPVLWWAFIPALLWLGWHWFTTRDWRAGSVWIAFAAGWLVWFPDLRRTMFLFYMAPLIPFLIIAVVLALGTMLGPEPPPRRAVHPLHYAAALRRRRWGVVGVAAYLGLGIADFVWMWPLFTGGLMTYGQWHAHMWLPSWI